MQMGFLRQQSRNSVLSYRISRDPIDLISIDETKKYIGQILKEIRPLIQTPQGREYLKDFEATLDMLNKEGDLLIEAMKNGDVGSAEKIFQTWQIKSDNNYASLLDFTSYEQRLSKDLYSLYENLINRILVFMMIFVVLFVVLTTLFFFYLRKTITKPLKKLSYVAQNIAEGRFNFNFNVLSNDEIGTLSINLKKMSGTLQKHQKRLEKDVLKKEEELKKLKEFESQKDDFISVASHELKTPITSLKLYGQLLERIVRKNKHRQYGTYLKKMDGQIDRLTRLITSLLEVAKMQMGKIPFRMSHFDLDELIKEVAYIRQKKTTEHSIVVRGAIKRKIFGDRDMISQVMENLLSNAVKYSPKQKQIRVSVGLSKGVAIVSVQDYGIGIDKKHHDKIFDRFYRVSGTNESKYPGFGIGLYISRQIIKQHRGRLWVKSVKGKGSTFSFSLPVKAKSTTNPIG
ncbi:MAG: ATP-binding protein [Patescibacteria group bacterium]